MPLLKTDQCKCMHQKANTTSVKNVKPSTS